MMGKRLAALVILIFLGFGLLAQQSAIRCKTIPVSSQAFSLDSLVVLPSSIYLEISGEKRFDFIWNQTNETLQLKSQNLASDSVRVCYQVIPLATRQSVFINSPDLYDSAALFSSPPTSLAFGKEELFATDNIQKTGSISRGFSVGNTQNVFVNSSLNLQMEGQLNDKLNLRAVITDQNIPYQPEGNTQQVQDFDNVFIELYNENFSLTAGDIILQTQAPHFLKYYKNIQGLQAQYRSDSLWGGSGKTHATASVAKGKFASVQLEVQEGLAGPYRLRGAENERFIIVIANSERVFIDGRPLQRGFDFDYTIDYNTAEITFSNQLIITKYSRIRVDFEYAVQNYSRAIIAAGHNQTYDNWQFYTQFYQERDNRNNPLLYPLSDAEKQALADSEENQLLVAAADSIGFSSSEILYKTLDTVDASGRVVRIFQQSTGPDVAYFSVQFTEVGQGNGDYRQAMSTANGRVYEWVSPINGLSQGAYVPGRIIAAPNKKNVWVMGAKGQVGAHQQVAIELALSQQSDNLYNPDREQQGKALKLGWGFSSDTVQSRFWSVHLRSEIIEGTFKPIDRFRSIDFDRDWNLGLNESPVDEVYVQMELQARPWKGNDLVYSLSRRERGQQLQGWQHRGRLQQRVMKWLTFVEYTGLWAEQEDISSQWNRVEWRTEWLGKSVIPGYAYLIDRNQNLDKISNSYTPVANAFYFDEQIAYLKQGQSAPLQFLLEHRYRSDKLPQSGELLPSDASHTSTAQVGYQHIKRSVQLSAIYRNLKSAIDTAFQAPEESLLGRLDYNEGFWNDLVRWESTYAIGNGRELKREYIYWQVATGEGTHTWQDDNGDGQPTLDEFYEAITFDQRQYVKIFVPTDEYFTAYTLLFNQRLTFQPSRQWRTHSDIRYWLSFVSNVSVFTVDRKMSSERLSDRFNPFAQLEQEQLLSDRYLFRSSSFINQSSTRYALEFTYQQSRLQQLLADGYEWRQQTEYRTVPRVNIGSSINHRIEWTVQRIVSESDYLKGRNFQLEVNKIAPEVSWQPNATFRITGRYINQHKINRGEDGEKARFDEWQVESRWAKANGFTLQSSAKYSQIAYSGELNTAVGFQMLEALRPGDNFSWNLQWTQRLVAGLQLSVMYEGRKSPESPLIQVGRMQLTALF
ncbi:hypothetical protein QWY31_06665 [Cytophagales bacterium LB-30]|uniref:Uncharacterized protein n=1 Tax=Shiella aurantiaca TaxID=3058365 RepID=A0ABT8F3Z5_9BACT|nr:hypothetical protein [Shiella aurantiaca]MDN4165175.1 hypothetical protein [Shiella aurantiaca]